MTNPSGPDKVNKVLVSGSEKETLNGEGKDFNECKIK